MEVGLLNEENIVAVSEFVSKKDTKTIDFQFVPLENDIHKVVKDYLQQILEETK